MHPHRSQLKWRQYLLLSIILLTVPIATIFAFRSKTVAPDYPLSNTLDSVVNEVKTNPIVESVSQTITETVTDNTAGSVADDQDAKETHTLPTKSRVDVPFLVQAPHANWDALHEDACEEASLIMIKHFLSGDRSISIESGDQEIKDLVQYETDRGYGISITLDELSEIARDYLGMNAGIVKTIASADDIKREVARGNPVIIPAAGKILPNPNFRNGGPIYHMLVVTGYDKKGFITNDPGTRKGEDFRYTFDALYNAIHNWNPDDIMQGERQLLVFHK